MIYRTEYSDYDSSTVVRGSIPGDLFILQNGQNRSGAHAVPHSMHTGVPSPGESPAG